MQIVHEGMYLCYASDGRCEYWSMCSVHAFEQAAGQTLHVYRMVTEISGVCFQHRNDQVH